MKKKEPVEKSPKISFLKSLRMYFVVLKAMHKGKGPLRIIAAYIFFIFALFSFIFTIKVPVTRAFLTPGGWEKTQSRIISGFLILLNLIVYNMIMNWRKGNLIQVIIRIIVLASAIYLDALLIRIIYVLILDGTYF